ncbi:MAG TPA: aldehyde reductase [Solirubrobacteraceae bacterium]|jgi:nucleoside-diphosphate-sugar epimerase|nr:aldehyde reductase [Solirubrobacteraceae bacterium]
MAEPGGTVLVTGGTGFLGGWCAVELVRRGYAVRTTIRNLDRAEDLRASFAAAGVEAGERLSFAVADLTADEGWSEAVAGCDYVLHVASPFPPAQPKNPDELIVPARDGALRVLRAGLDAGVQRVVMTSSVAAVRHGRAPAADAPYNEADWTDPDDLQRTPYVRSKTIAELAAWDHVRARGAESRLAIVNPGAIIGPVLSEDRSFSLQVVERLLNGMPAMPRLGFVLVDVRDVADLHIRAMTDPAAGGERFLAVDRFLWMKDVSRILRERLGPAAKKVPTRVAPDLLIRAMGIFDPSVRTIVNDLGESPTYTAEKAKATLGWEPRSTEDSIADTAQSLLERGLAGS